MDEEDGRSGARAVKIGLIDAPRGVPTLPLRTSSPNPNNFQIWVPQVSLLTLGTRDALFQIEENHENVPGK